MKIRKGFVSNSSSSSFVCDVCGEEYSGYDASLQDAEMQCCLNDHTFCISHAKKCPELKTEEKRSNLIKQFNDCAENNTECGNWKDATEDEIEDAYPDFFDEYTDVDPRFCPCCTFKEIAKEDLIRYMYFKLDTDKKEIIKEIKNKYNSYDELMKDIDKK